MLVQQLLLELAVRLRRRRQPRGGLLQRLVAVGGLAARS